ncbi:glycosyltransferase [Heliobacterium mobile]|nr:glycosyltransferase [Heliobacterium mobile]
MPIDNVLVLGMYPYPWHHRELSDTMRMMTRVFPVRRKLFLNPPVGARQARTDRYPWQMGWTSRLDGDVYVCTPPLERLPSAFRLHHVKNRWASAQLPRFIEQMLGTSNWRDQTVVYLSSGGIGQSYEIFQALRPRFTIFDVLDDNLGFPGLSDSELQSLYRQFSQLLRESTVVTAVSSHLVDKISYDHEKKAAWLPNGVDVDRFAYHPDYGEALPELAGLEGPLLGFVGAITSWVDLELLQKIAESLSQGTVVLVGPVVESAVDKAAMDALRDHRRVVFLGAQPYERVPHFLHQFDILLLPRNYQPHSLASDPLKLYEYLATGKPVLSSALPSALRFRDLIYLGESHDDILQALNQVLRDEVLRKDSFRSSQRVGAARSLSWSQRANRMMEILFAAISNEDEFDHLNRHDFFKDDINTGKKIWQVNHHFSSQD